MTATTIRVQMAQRKDTAANWTAANPVLLSGEIGYETDTKKFKIGNGSTAWNSLAYLPIPDGSGNLTITGNLEIGSTGSLTFEGSTADGFETTLAVTNPTADRTITLPNVSGTVVTTGDTGSVTSTMLADGTIIDADISATAEIAVSKLANGTANQVIVTDGTNVSWSDNLTLAGDLTVNGTTTTINTQDLLVKDKNIIIGNVTSPSDLTADGGGITLKGATDKTINWVDATDAWTLSEHVNIASGKEYRIAGTKVLDATGLGSSVLITSANITDGTIVNGDINASAAIAGTKISPDFGSQNVTTTGTSTAASFIPTSSTAPSNGVYLPASNSVAISTNGTGRLFVDSSGRLGLGTSSPRSLLNVAVNSSAGSILTLENTNTAPDAGWYLGRLQFYGNDDSANASGVRASIDAAVTGAGATTDIVFSNTTFLDSTLYERMRITAQGNVGIGTTPAFGAIDHGLHIKGSGAQEGIRLETTDGSGGILEIYSENGGNTLDTRGSGYIRFNTQTTEWGRWDSSGRFLVGTSSVTATASTSTNNLLAVESTNNYLGVSFTANCNDSNGSYLVLKKSRGTTAGSNTVVQSGDEIGNIFFEATDGSASRSAAAIRAFVDATPGASDMPGRLVFSTCPDSSASPVERLRLSQNGEFISAGIYNFSTSNAANVYIFSSGELRRSTSSGKYKTNVETLEDAYSDALLSCRPVWYRSTCDKDNPDWGWWGFIAEEVAEIDPRLVHWKTSEVTYDENGSAVETPCDPEPEGVAYDRFVPHLLNLIKRQKEQIEAMEARLSALEAS